jgi:hypothetical protein
MSRKKVIRDVQTKVKTVTADLIHGVVKCNYLLFPGGVRAKGRAPKVAPMS